LAIIIFARVKKVHPWNMLKFNNNNNIVDNMLEEHPS
jgi:hypothetical protein